MPQRGFHGLLRISQLLLFISVFLFISTNAKIPSWFPPFSPARYYCAAKNNSAGADMCGSVAYGKTTGLYCYCDDVCFTTYNDCCGDIISVCMNPVVFSLSPANPDTSGGTVITIAGNKFYDNLDSDFGFKVYGSTVVCSLMSMQKLVCTFPALTSANFPALAADRVITIKNKYLATKNFSLSYASPTIISIFPTSGPTGPVVATGLPTSLTITGTNFGPIGGATINVGSFPCSLVSQTHTSIICQMSPGYGASNANVVNVTAHAVYGANPAIWFQFLPPTITATVVASPKARTAGGDIVTITGTNLGAVGSPRTVTVGGVDCPITGSNTLHTNVFCTLPPGQGEGLEVHYTVGGQDTTVFTFSYDPPVIISVSSSSGPTIGSTTNPSTFLTINGLNFGTSSAIVTVKIGAADVLSCPACTRNHTSMQVRVPAGEGLSNAVTVTVQSQSAVQNNPSSPVVYSYNAPTILSTSPSISTSGNVILTLTGINFGTNPRVAVDAVYQTVLSSSQTTATFLLAPGHGSRSITVDHRSGFSPVYTFSYMAPNISAATPLKAVNTSGGQSMIIDGSSFGDITATVNIGTLLCSIVTWTHSRINCTIPSGVGANLDVVLTTATGVSRLPSAFSFSRPSMTVATYSGNTDGGDSIVITGNNFGNVSGSASVLISGSQCIIHETVLDHSHTKLVCTSPPGVGVNLPILLTVAGQLASETVLFSYNPPSIFTVLPTVIGAIGGDTVFITGSNFGASKGNVTFNQIWTGSMSCTIITWKDSSITCSAPPGRGVSRAVKVTTADGRFSSGSISYRPPSITDIISVQANTAGGNLITVVGSNFGQLKTGLSVSIGGSPCTVSTVSSTQIVCAIPPKISDANGVVVVADGQSTTDSISFIYDKPVITSILPAIDNTDRRTGAATNGTTRITVLGSNFGTGSVSRRIFRLSDSVNCSSITEVSAHTSLSCVVPSGVGGPFMVVVSVGTGLSAGYPYSYRGPSLSSVRLPSGQTGLSTRGGDQIILIGNNFGTVESAVNVFVGSQCADVLGNQLASCPCAISQRNQTHILCSTPNGQGASTAVRVEVAGIPSNSITVQYFPPTLTSFSPALFDTSGGKTVFISGSNFGVGIANSIVIRIAGLACFNPQYLNYTCVSCTVGEGSGSLKALTVEVAQQLSANQLFLNYSAPTISSVVPVVADSSAADVIVTISGNNFGNSAVPRSITLSGNGVVYACLSPQVQVPHTKLICLLQPGMGANLHFAVAVDGLVSVLNPSSLFSFAPPVISSISPSSAPALGGGVITLSGTSFGTIGNVTVGGVACQSLNSYSHSSVGCAVPQGTGRNLGVSISVSNATFTLFNSFSYQVPSLISLTTGMVPHTTKGGYLLTIFGSNFGQLSSNVIVNVGPSLCIPINSVSDGSIVCSVPGGSGSSAVVSVSVSTQTSSNSLTFPFDPPVITSVSNILGCSTVGTSVESCQFGQSIVLNIHGINFGTTTATISVGGVFCSSISNKNHTNAQCTLAAWSQQNFANLPVVLTVAGQSSIPKALVSFSGPVITRFSCNSPCSSVPVNGGTNLTIFGQGFDSVSTNNIVNYGPSSNPNKYQCQTTSSNATVITCTLAMGVGKGLFLSVSRNMTSFVLNSLLSTSNISYVAPVIQPSSLRSFPTDNESPSLTATKSVNQYVDFRVANLGSFVEEVSVGLGPSGSSGPTISCNGVSFPSAGRVACFVDKGQGSDWHMFVSVGGQMSQAGTDSFSFPRPAEVYAVSGCQDSQNATINCPTEGSIPITITGDFFTPNSTSVIIGPSQCQIVSISVPRSLVCMLAAGVGANLPITVITAKSYSRSAYLLSYALPILTGIQGCGSSSPSTVISNCSRSSTSQITITGSNFGASNAIVFIGEKACTNVIHDASFSTAHRRIRCNTPSDSGLLLPVSVMQGGGQISYNSLFLSYQVCAAGYADIPRQIACQACGPGSYSSIPGSLSCSFCPDGTASNISTATSCLECPIGKYAKQGTTNGALSCSPCPLGFANSSPRQADCTPCPEGSYADRLGQVECSKCAIGTSNSGTKKITPCSNCSSGTFTNTIGSISCSDCAAGTASSLTGSSFCPSCSDGMVQLNTRQSVCSKCPMGMSQSQFGQLFCTSCTPGFFANTSGQSTCSKCPPGFASSKPQFGIGPVSCDKCPVGMFSPTSGQAECLSCPLGTYQNVSGSTACIACPIGKFADKVEQSQCSDCAIGKYAPDTGSAVCLSACPAGRFSGSTGKSSCDLCPAGRYQDQAGATTCNPCKAGSSSQTEGQTSCTICPAGTFSSNDGSRLCTNCPQGSASPNAGASSCSNCTIGQYQSLTGQRFCSPCPTGTFMSMTGKATCIPCGPGTSAPRTGSSSCESCPPGEFAESGQSSCTKCPLGRFGSISNTSCTLCSAGSYQDLSGQTSCKACPAGKYASSLEQVTCLDCDPGRYSNQTRSATCTVCKPGSYQSAPGQTSCIACPAGSYSSAAESPSCLPCSSGSFSTATGASSCSGKCTAGFFSGSGALSCTRCPAGKSNGGNESSSCVDCDVGKYRDDGSNPSSCISALPGFYVPSRGAVSAVPCEPGTFQPNSGQSSCIACNAGEFQPERNATSSCQRCTPGTFSGESSSSCTSCPIGRYSDDFGSKQCKAAEPGKFVATIGSNSSVACPAGTSQSTEQATSCDQCQPGSYSDQPGSIRCKLCPAKTFESDSGSQGPCSLCQAGSYSDGVGSSSCSLCQPGRFGDSPGLSSCPICQIGRFSNVFGATTCSFCPIGTMSHPKANEPRTECDLCPTGRFQINNGSSDCIPCSSGRFSASTGSSDCTLCPPGSYQSEEESTSCIPCLRGQYQLLSGSTSCIDCPPGQYGDVSSIKQCSNCRAGQYQDRAGQGLCIDCPAGTFAKDDGMSSCVPCGIGTFSTGGATICTPCPIGAFSNGSASSSCNTCPIGYSTLRAGSDNCVACDMGKYKTEDGPCLLCPAGTVSSAEGSSRCTSCPVGTRSSSAGGTFCEMCPKGTFSDTVGSDTCTKCSPGFYSDASGAVRCQGCQPGSYAESSSSSSCMSCPSGSYQPVANSSRCLLCPAGSRSSAASSSCSLCPIGTSSHNGSADCSVCGPHLVAPSVGSPVCLSCSSTSSPDSTKRVCKCNPGYYYQIGSPPEEPCTPCPFGADCSTFGTTNATLFALDGYWRTQEGQFYRCQFASHCPMVESLNGACPEGREGPLCGICKRGFHDTWGNVCSKCPPAALAFIGFVLLTILVCALVVLQLYLIVRAGSDLMHMDKAATAAAAADISSASPSVKMSSQLPQKSLLNINPRHFVGAVALQPNFMFKMKILLGFFQITTNLSSTLDVPWPPQYKLFISWFSPFNFDLSGITMVSCVFDTNFYSTFASACATPFCLIALVTFGYLLPRRYCRTSTPSAQKRTRRRYWRMVLFLLFLFYPGTSSIILRLFNCISVNNVDYLLSDVRTQCYTSTWYTFRNISPIFIFIYPIGVPLFFIWSIYRVRGRLSEPGIKAQVGFLYDAFSPRFWWFDIVDNLHKLFLTSLLPFFGGAFRSYQISIGLAITTIYTLILLMLNPYQRKGDDRLHLLVQIAIFMYMLAAQVFYSTDIIDDAMNWVVSIVLIFCTLLLIAFFFAQAALFLRKTFCPRRKGRAVPEPVYVERVQDVDNNHRGIGGKGTSGKHLTDLARERQSVNPLYNQVAVQRELHEDDADEDMDYGHSDMQSNQISTDILNLSRSLNSSATGAFGEALIQRREFDVNDEE